MKYYKNIRGVILGGFILLTLLITNTAEAETITTDTVWDKTASPYIIQEDVVVEAGATLTIEPGVVVQLGVDIYFNISGQLIVNGTDEERVTLTSLSTPDLTWGGIVINSGASYEINHTDILYAYDTIVSVSGTGVITDTNFSDCYFGIKIEESSLGIKNSSFKNIARSAIEAFGYSELDIDSTKFEDIYDIGIMLDWHSNLNLMNSSLERLNLGVDVSRHSSATITDTIIKYSEIPIEAMEESSVAIFDSEISVIYPAVEAVGIYYKSKLILENSKVVGTSTKRLLSFFDSTGEIINSSLIGGTEFTIKSSGSVVIARMNWWGSSSGPGSAVSEDVDVSNWLTVDSEKEPARTPVIIIPGVLSSYINHNDYNKTEVWLNLAKALIPGDDDYLDELKMNEIGEPTSNFSLVATDIIREINGKEFFSGLISELESSGYVEGVDLFVFPYDWRLSIGKNKLGEKIDEVLEKSGSEKVDIVAHSMGGLLTKYYLKNFGGEKVRKFVDIGTPHLGSPNAFQILMYGDNLNVEFGPLGLNQDKIKEISQNMMSGYQLLPTSDYFSSDPNYLYYVHDLSDFDNDGVRGRLSDTQSRQFLKNTGRNDVLLNIAPNLQSSISDLDPVNLGVETHNIIGCGTPTLGKFFMLGKQGEDDPEYDVAYISGDGTVPQKSAEHLNSSQSYYVEGTTHALMPSTNGIKQLVSSILAGTEDTFDLNFYGNISVDKNNCQIPDSRVISVHSPVDLEVQTSDGQVIYPDIIDGNKFAFLPDDQEYEIKLTATDVGTFSSHVKKIENGEVVSTTYFKDVPIQNIDQEFIIDIDSDNPDIITGSQVFVPAAIVSGDAVDDKVPPEFSLSVDPLNFELKVLGVDNISKATVIKTGNIYTATDAYGNLTKMNIAVKKENERRLNYTITFPALPKEKLAVMIFDREMDRNNKLKSFTQIVKQGRDTIIYTYRSKKDRTVVRLRDNKEIQKIVYPEQKEVLFLTDKGIIKLK